MVDAQARYAQRAYDAYTSEMSKLGKMYVGTTHNASEPIDEVELGHVIVVFVELPTLVDDVDRRHLHSESARRRVPDPSPPRNCLGGITSMSERIFVTL